jgi:mannose-6-phosphate isomerase-like protein (cupin superfamily)
MIRIALSDRPQFVAGDGTHLREVLHPAQVPATIPYSLAHAVVRPGESSIPHSLRGSEVYYILSGTGIMHVDGEQAEVGPDTAIYVPPDATQHIQNTGLDDLVFLCIVHPAWRPEDETVAGSQ